ncbi:MAG: FAD-binding protein [Patescibacteria group bacterium]|nr:FAD-binding protein [Patescibacteria group bacterium]
MTKAQDQLINAFGPDRVFDNKDISPYLTLRTKVTAELYLELRTREECLSFARLRNSLGIPILFLGGGSNVAIVSPRFPGLIVRNQYQRKEIVSESPTDVLLLVSSGYIVTQLAKETVEAGYEGFEYQFGLPGTMGGGIYMNSKWTKPDSWLGDRLESAVLLDANGNERSVTREYFEFDYGYSKLQDTGELFLEGFFRLPKADPEVLKQRLTATKKHRDATQPKGAMTSGCFFKNISEEERLLHNLPTKSAGYLIDQAGLKNYAVGDFYVSDIHANFIINRGNGKPEDLERLTSHIRTTVKNRFGIDLRNEVIVL